MASNSKNVKIQILKVGASGVPITPTGASKAKPSVITTAGTLTAADGDLAVLASNSTALSSLDGNMYSIGNLIADTSFELGGSDATADTGTFAAGGAIIAYGDVDFMNLCLSTFSVSPGSPSTTSTATFCDPTGSVPSAVVEAGTVSIGGYIDISSPDYQEMLDWSIAGGERLFRITMPNNGMLAFKATIGSMNWDIPIDGALAWSAELTLGGAPRHLFTP